MPGSKSRLSDEHHEGDGARSCDSGRGTYDDDPVAEGADKHVQEGVIDEHVATVVRHCRS